MQGVTLASFSVNLALARRFPLHRASQVPSYHCNPASKVTMQDGEKDPFPCSFSLPIFQLTCCRYQQSVIFLLGMCYLSILALAPNALRVLRAAKKILESCEEGEEGGHDHHPPCLVVRSFMPAVNLCPKSAHADMHESVAKCCVGLRACCSRSEGIQSHGFSQTLSR